MESIEKWTQSHQVSQLLAVLFILFIRYVLVSCVLLLVFNSTRVCFSCFFFRLFFSCVWVCVCVSMPLLFLVSKWLNEWLRAERINFTLITLTILLYIREHKYVLACVVVRVVIISIISRAVIVISCRCLWSVCDVLWHITLYDGFWNALHGKRG